MLDRHAPVAQGFLAGAFSSSPRSVSRSDAPVSNISLSQRFTKKEGSTMAVRAIPEGFHSVTPSMPVDGARKFIDFIKQAFGAEETVYMPSPDGKVMHAELKIGDSIIMTSDPMGGFEPMPSTLMLYVKDVDAVFKRAVQAGAKSVIEPSNMFWGDRSGRVKDPFGNFWILSTHVEDVTPAEMEKRAKAFMQSMSKQ
jgi:uncharacterized glyoxalase superfamily protein PhnB